MDFDLSQIPNKKYFTIKEVSAVCQVETHTLRYWEKEFDSIFSIQRSGNRRLYQQQDIINLIKIKNLLNEGGMTIKGAKAKLKDLGKEDSINFKIIEELKDILNIIKN